MSLELRKETSVEVINPDSGNVAVYMNTDDVMMIKESDGSERELVPRFYDSSGESSDYYRSAVNIVVNVLPSTGVEGRRYLNKADGQLYTFIEGEFVQDSPPVLGSQCAVIGAGSDTMGTAMFINLAKCDKIETPFQSSIAVNTGVFKWNDRVVVVRTRNGVSTLITIDPSGDMDLIEVFGAERIRGYAVDRNGYMWVVTRESFGVNTGLGQEILGAAKLYKFEYEQVGFPYTVYSYNSGTFPHIGADAIADHAGSLVILSHPYGQYEVKAEHFQVVDDGGGMSTVKVSWAGATGADFDIVWKNAGTKPAFVWNAGESKWIAPSYAYSVTPVAGDVVANDIVNIASIDSGHITQYKNTGIGWGWVNLDTKIISDLVIDSLDFDNMLMIGNSNKYVNDGANFYISNWNRTTHKPKFIKFDGTDFSYVAGAVTSLWDSAINRPAIIAETDSFLWISCAFADIATGVGIFRVNKTTESVTRFFQTKTARVFIDQYNDSDKEVYAMERINPGTVGSYDIIHKYDSATGLFVEMKDYTDEFKKSADAVIGNDGYRINIPFIVNHTASKYMIFTHGEYILRANKGVGWSIIPNMQECCLPSVPPVSGVEEAPEDGFTYARKDAGWEKITVTGIEEAPVDSKIYARSDAGWMEIIIPPAGVEEAPEDGLPYVRVDADWVLMPVPPAGVEEAPEDSKLYARIDAGWQEIVIPPAGVEEAPEDSKLYGRSDAGWMEIVIPAAGIGEAPEDGKQYARKDAGWDEVAAVDPGVITVIAGEDIEAGRMVAIINNGGVPTAIKANALISAGTVIKAFGFVKSAVLTGNPIDVSMGGLVVMPDGMTEVAGLTLFLGTDGTVSLTPPIDVDDIQQEIGFTTGGLVGTEMFVRVYQPITVGA